jgi:hypothetical protein
MSIARERATVIRRLASPIYAAGVRQTVNIDRDGVLWKMSLRLNFTVTNAATGPVGPRWMTLARLIRRVEVIVGGVDTVVSVTGAHLASRAQVENGKRARGMSSTIVLTNSAVTNYEIILPLPFFLPKGVRPDDTGLDLRNVQQATLAITWGDASDLFTTPNGATVSAVSLVPTGHYYVNAPDKQLFMVRALDMLEQNSPATNANLSLLMDRASDLWWRSFHIATLRDQVAVQNIITGDFRVFAGAWQYLNADGPTILARTEDEYNMPVAEFPAADQVYRVDFNYLAQDTTTINAAALQADLLLALGVTYTSGTEVISVSREAKRFLRL